MVRSEDKKQMGDPVSEKDCWGCASCRSLQEHRKNHLLYYYTGVTSGSMTRHDHSTEGDLLQIKNRWPDKTNTCDKKD